MTVQAYRIKQRARRLPQFLISEPVEAILNGLGDALDLVDVGILLLDHEFRARFVNRRLTEMLNIPPGMWASGFTFRDLLNAEATEWFDVSENELAQFLGEREAAVRAGFIPPTQISAKDGRRLLLSCSACPDGGRVLTYIDVTVELQREANKALEAGSADMRFQNETLESQAAYLASLAEEADESARAVEAARMELELKMAEQRLLEAELRRLANFDGLTGALNRSTFMASAQTLLEQGGTFAALMLDVDHFKTINDRYGHAAGDHALRQLATMLQGEIRDRDLLGRLGGEEFAVLLKIRSPEEAIAIAERLRCRAAQTPLTSGNNRFVMTISVGVAVRESSDSKIDDLIARADTALYQAKAAGRNQVVTAWPATAA